MSYYLNVNPLNANVQFFNHLGFEPGVQVTEPPGVVEMVLEIDLFS